MNRLKFIAMMAFFVSGSISVLAEKPLTLLNVSYDPTREFYNDVNAAFSSAWKQKTGQTLIIRQSHGGSGKQARAVIDGLEGDVVTLALAYDVDALAEKGKLIPHDWQKRLPHNSSPYYSTIVFVVKKGNPKQIKDWGDLIKKGVKIVTPNPKTSGGARWNYLAAYGYALKKNNGDEATTKKFIEELYRHAPILDAGARAATTTFIQRKMGDVLIAWENEALLAVKKIGQGKFEIVYPSISILAEPPVSLVDKVVDRRGTRAVAEAYLEFLYTDAGQEIAAKNYFRTRSKTVTKKYEETFPNVKLFTIDDTFGGWEKAQKIHFNDGGLFDQISKSRR